MKTILLVGGLWIDAIAALGQAYAAPGMPVRVPGHQPIKLTGVSSLRVPAKPDETGPIPRFWLDADSAARKQGAAQLVKTIQRHAKLPRAALTGAAEGRIFVRIVLSATGEPAAVEIVGRSSSLASASAEAVGELDAETIRVAQLLRFVAKVGAIDSVVFPLVYWSQ